MRLELNKKYELPYIEGKPVFWLHTIESFLYRKSYVVHLTITDKPGISTLRFSTHPSEDDVMRLYIDRYIKHKFV